MDWEESSQANNTVASNTGASLGTMSLASSLMKDEMMTSVDCLPKISQQRIESLAKGKAKYIPEEFNAHTRYKNFMAEAKLDPTIPHFNSSFSEYKFEKFQRRIEFTETKFPKTLNLSFAQTLIPKRGQTSHGPVRPKKDLKYSDRPGSVAAGGEEDDEDTGSPGSRKQGGLRRHGSVSQTDSTDLYSTGNNNNLNQSSNGGLRRSPSALSIASEQTSTYDVGQDDWVDETGWDDDNNSFGSAGSLNDRYCSFSRICLSLSLSLCVCLSLPLSLPLSLTLSHSHSHSPSPSHLCLRSSMYYSLYPIYPIPYTLYTLRIHC